MNFVKEELLRVENKASREKVIDSLVKPYKQFRIWECGDDEKLYPIWIFAKIQNETIGLAYAEIGGKVYGCPWGMIFFNKDSFGSNNCFYKTLNDLLSDACLWDEC